MIKVHDISHALDLTTAIFVLFVYGEKLLLNHKMNNPLPWYFVLRFYSPAASKLSVKSHLPSTSSRASSHFLDNFSASGLYNSTQHTTQVVYSQIITQFSTDSEISRNLKTNKSQGKVVCLDLLVKYVL